MLPDITPDMIRQQPNISRVEEELSDCATRFALLGRVDVARQLVELLYERGATLGYEAINEFLKFAWHESNQWPQGWPSDRSEIPSEDQYQAERNESWRLPEGHDGEDRAMLDACLGVEDDEFADETTGSSAMDKGQRLVRALEISVKLHQVELQSESTGTVRRSKRAKAAKGHATPQTEPDTRFRVSDLDPESADILNRIVARLRANSQIEFLGEAKRMWPFYLRGLLADAVDISDDEIEEKSQELIEAFKDRFQHGSATSRLADKTVKELLEIGDRETRNYLNSLSDDDDTWGPVPQSLFKAPATDEEIAKLEEALNIVLPDDYKAFLKISNGFVQDDDTGMIIDEYPHPALHDNSGVKWVEEEYFQLPVDLLDLPREYEDLVGTENKKSKPDGDFDWDTVFPLFDRVLEVGTRDIDNLWLVQPELVKQSVEQYRNMFAKADENQKKVIVRAMESFAGSKEAFESLDWCFAQWSSGGSASMSFYPSFTHYLRHIVEESMETG